MFLRTILIGHVLHAYLPTAFATKYVKREELVGFVEGDNSRDTISLIISCLVTLGLCVYSAVHLNVPAKKENFFKALLRDVKWCVIGLFAPELVLYTAWRQYASAKQLCDEVQQTRAVDFDGNEGKVNFSENIVPVKHSDSIGQQKYKYPWTLAHGFYGTMGGITIELDTAPNEYAQLFGNIKRLTLTAKGVSLLAQCGHLPEISLDDIKDKNKTDSLAKFLVCIQAGWMVIQVICRRALHYPTSLLEVHTVAHVVCALLMYGVWWYKPRHVASPTKLRGEWVWPLAAYMFLGSRISGQRPEGKLGKFLHPKPELKQLAYVEGSPEDSTAVDHRHLEDARGHSRGHFVPLPPSPSKHHRQEHQKNTSEEQTFATLKALATQAVELYPAIRSKFTQPKDDHLRSTGSELLIPYATEFIQYYSLNWPNAGLLRRTQSLIMGMTLWGASMVYGAIHVSAWDYFFPTYEERLLWRLSSIWVTFCAGFWLMIHLLAYFFPMIDRIWVAFNDRRLGWLGTGVITLLCILCGLSFVASRAFLVIDAFVSIREVPARVYETPNWSQVFPHL